MEKKATRDSYGEALVMLAEKRPDLVVLDDDLAAATKTGTFRRLTLTDSSTAVSQRQT